jgi:hypothetical protein
MSQRIRIAGLLLTSMAIAFPATTHASASISAEVTGKGAKRELTWWVMRHANQTVTFEERGGRASRVLGFSRGGTGSVRFRPTKGAAGTRRIVATVKVKGVVSETLTVVRFRVRR